MALREREIRGIVADADGIPVTDGKVRFKPTTPLGLTSTHIIVDREFEATTDSITGAFSRTLWCDEDSLSPINYNVFFPVGNGQASDPLHAANFSLVYGDGSPIDLGFIIGSQQQNPPPPTETLNNAIDQRTADRALLYAVPQTLTAEQKQQAQSNLGITGGGGGGGGMPAGADTQIQFNVNGAFGATTSFVWQNNRLGVGINAPIAKAHIKTDAPGERVLFVDGAANQTAPLISAGKNGNPNFFVINSDGAIEALNGNTARIASALGKPFFPDGLITAQLQSFTNTPATLIMNENSGTEFIFQSNHAASTPIAARAAVAQTADVFRGLKSDGTDAFVLDKNLTPGVKVNAAPADADIDANQLFYWFDSNNAAPKVMFKAKRADGTVVSAAINLT